mmetsp:Transcript_13794/g.33957  ORF Transcript_13794/g.33957 Transcript_13794/m.33957 type:complete len:1234 (+) Transcript_13794:56-3757(+)
MLANSRPPLSARRAAAQERHQSWCILNRTARTSSTSSAANADSLYCDSSDNCVYHSERPAEKDCPTNKYTFDRVIDNSLNGPNSKLDPAQQQEALFEGCFKPLLETAANEGKSAHFVGFGPKSAGKTFLLTGGSESFMLRGLIPRTLTYLFEKYNAAGSSAASMKKDGKNTSGRSGSKTSNLSNANSSIYSSSSTSTTSCSKRITVSFFEIYKHRIVDLLCRNGTTSSQDEEQHTEDQHHRTSLEVDGHELQLNVQEKEVRDESDAYHRLFYGDARRHFEKGSETSRGHCVFIVNVEDWAKAAAKTTNTNRFAFSFVDLAAADPEAVGSAVTAVRENHDALFKMVNGIAKGDSEGAREEPPTDKLCLVLRSLFEDQSTARSCHFCVVRDDPGYLEMKKWLRFGVTLKKMMANLLAQNKLSSGDNSNTRGRQDHLPLPHPATLKRTITPASNRTILGMNYNALYQGPGSASATSLSLSASRSVADVGVAVSAGSSMMSSKTVQKNAYATNSFGSSNSAGSDRAGLVKTQTLLKSSARGTGTSSSLSLLHRSGGARSLGIMNHTNSAEAGSSYAGKVVGRNSAGSSKKSSPTSATTPVEVVRLHGETESSASVSKNAGSSAASSPSESGTTTSRTSAKGRATYSFGDMKLISPHTLLQQPQLNRPPMSSPTGENGNLPGSKPFSPVGLDMVGLGTKRSSTVHPVSSQRITIRPPTLGAGSTTTDGGGKGRGIANAIANSSTGVGVVGVSPGSVPGLGARQTNAQSSFSVQSGTRRLLNEHQHPLGAGFLTPMIRAKELRRAAGDDPAISIKAPAILTPVEDEEGVKNLHVGSQLYASQGLQNPYSRGGSLLRSRSVRPAVGPAGGSTSGVQSVLPSRTITGRTVSAFPRSALQVPRLGAAAPAATKPKTDAATASSNKLLQFFNLPRAASQQQPRPRMSGMQTVPAPPPGSGSGAVSSAPSTKTLHPPAGVAAATTVQAPQPLCAPISRLSLGGGHRAHSASNPAFAFQQSLGSGQKHYKKSTGGPPATTSSAAATTSKDITSAVRLPGRVPPPVMINPPPAAQQHTTPVPLVVVKKSPQTMKATSLLGTATAGQLAPADPSEHRIGRINRSKPHGAPYSGAPSPVEEAVNEDGASPLYLQTQISQHPKATYLGGGKSPSGQAVELAAKEGAHQIKSNMKQLPAFAPKLISPTTTSPGPGRAPHPLLATSFKPPSRGLLSTRPVATLNTKPFGAG